MRRQGLPLLAAVLVVSFVIATVGGLSPGQGVVGSDFQPAAGSASISIAAVANFGYQPDTIGNLPLNATITVTFTDDDVLPHTFNISSREGFQIPNDYTAAQLNQLFDSFPALYAAEVGFEGAVSVGSFTSPSTPGWYEFLCNESGHFSEGMYGFIAFGESVPANLTQHGTGSEIPTAGSALISGVGGAAIVVVIVGVVVWRRRRSAQRPDPGPPRRS